MRTMPSPCLPGSKSFFTEHSRAVGRRGSVATADLVNVHCQKVSTSRKDRVGAKINRSVRLNDSHRNLLNPKAIVTLCRASKPCKPLLASSLRLFCAYPRQGYKEILRNSANF